MFKEAARRLSFLYNSVKAKTIMREMSRAWKNKDRLKTDLESLWMEYRYGWRPLFADLEGAVKAIEKRLSGELDRPFLTVRAKSERRFAASTTVSANAGMQCDYLATGEVSVSATCRVRMDALVTDALPRKLVDVGINDPLLVAWELATLSFVVDWVVGVGRFLDGLNAMQGLTFRGGTSTLYLDVTMKPTIQPISAGLMVKNVTLPVHTGRYFKRVTVQPVSKLVWYGGSKMDISKGLDAAILLQQKLKRLVK